MKYALYDILLHIALILSLPYFLFKAITTRKYREGLAERLGFIDADKTKGLSGSVVWFHAISVGETKAVEPVLRLFKRRNPGVGIVLSTVTLTGSETARKSPGLYDALIYFPLDLSWAVDSAIGRVRPSAVVIVEKEVWPNFYRALFRRSIPLIIINGAISERSRKRFARFRFFIEEVFGMVSFFSARSKEDLERAVSAGVPRERAEFTGNIKFDMTAPAAGAAKSAPLESALGIRPGDAVIVAGSTHEGEEDMILAAFKRLKDETPLKLVIAPRHPERFAAVEAIIKRCGLKCARRSSGARAGADVVLLDTVGELITVYSFATIAVVGGSLVAGVGGHNLLEPALLARPVVYGPHIESCLHMAELLESAGGGFRVDDGAGLYETLKTLLTDPARLQEAGEAAKAAVEANRGAAERTVEIIEGFLKGKRQARRGH